MQSDATSAASRAHASIATRTADRLMCWSSALLLGLEGFAAVSVYQPPNGCTSDWYRSQSLSCATHTVLLAKSPPRQLPCAPRMGPAGQPVVSNGRHGQGDREPSGPNGQGQVTAEAVQRAASDMPPEPPGQPCQRTDGQAARSAGPSRGSPSKRAVPSVASIVAQTRKSSPEIICPLLGAERTSACFRISTKLDE